MPESRPPLTIDGYEWFYEPQRSTEYPWRYQGRRAAGRTNNVFGNNPLTAAEHRAIADVLDMPDDVPAQERNR